MINGKSFNNTKVQIYTNLSPLALSLCPPAADQTQSMSCR